jgi:hypothetical protein
MVILSLLMMKLGKYVELQLALVMKRLKKLVIWKEESINQL